MTQQSLAPRMTTLRDGRDVTLRPLAESDRDAMLAFGMSLPEDDRLYLELDFHNPNTIVRLVNASEAENWRQVVAVTDEGIVGYGNVRMLSGWKRQVGDSHLVISEGWRRSGLGTYLARTLIDAARELNASKVIIEMIEEQAVGRSIFEHLGFRLEGTLANHVRDHAGELHNIVILGYQL